YLRVLETVADFRVFLDDRNDVAPDLERQHRGLDELRVLEAVADDRRLVVGDRDDSQQLRLGARLETELVGPAEVEHLFDDLPLLIDLDRVDAAVAALVLVLGDGSRKRGVNVGETMFEDVGEADEDGKADAAQLQAIDQLLQVDRALRILRRVHLHVALAVDGEVAVAPARDLVELAGV